MLTNCVVVVLFAAAKIRRGTMPLKIFHNVFTMHKSRFHDDILDTKFNTKNKFVKTFDFL